MTSSAGRAVRAVKVLCASPLFSATFTKGSLEHFRIKITEYVRTFRWQTFSVLLLARSVLLLWNISNRCRYYYHHRHNYLLSMLIGFAANFRQAFWRLLFPFLCHEVWCSSGLHRRAVSLYCFQYHYLKLDS